MLSVVDVATKMGWEQDKYDKTKYRRGDCSVIISPDGLFNSFKPGYEYIKGAGALAFLMKTENKDFREAVRLYREIVGNVGDIYLRGISLNENRVKNEEKSNDKKTKTLFRPPYISANMPALIEYLCEERCLSKNLVLRLIAEGLLYPSEDKIFEEEKFIGKEKTAVFVYVDANGNRGGYQHIYLEGERRGFKKFSYGSRKSESAFVLRGEGDRSKCAVLFEGVLDALSYIELGYRSDETLISFGGSASPSHPILTGYSEYIYAFDNDEQGFRFDLIFLSSRPGKVIKSCCKDFNEDLKLCKDMEEKLKQELTNVQEQKLKMEVCHERTC